MTRALWTAYRLRLKRKRLLFRSFRSRRQLSQVVDRTGAIAKTDVLVVSVVRNEVQRLPYFLSHHRRLGVRHFLIVDNGSDDGTREYLAGQPDVSLWSTNASYKASRFGVDWATYLLMKYGHDHWCLTLDADEIFVYPFHETRPISALTAWLDGCEVQSFGAMMLDLYPKGRLGDQTYIAGSDPADILSWFDAGNYTIDRHPELESLWMQGGVRARNFFQDAPRRAPTLNKTPLVKWSRHYAYVNSTHSVLPKHLNHVYDSANGEKLSGVLLHTKFLPSITQKSQDEIARQQHFTNSQAYDDYYHSLMGGPALWCDRSTRYTGWEQLVSLGLMSQGPWP